MDVIGVREAADDDESFFCVDGGFGVEAGEGEVKWFAGGWGLEMGIVERFAEGAVDVDGAGWVLTGVEVALGDDGAEVGFVERCGEVSLPADKRLEDFDLVGGLVGA